MKLCIGAVNGSRVQTHRNYNLVWSSPNALLRIESPKRTHSSSLKLLTYALGCHLEHCSDEQPFVLLDIEICDHSALKKSHRRILKIPS